MRTQTLTKTGTGTTDWLVVDPKANPFNVGFGCAVTGTATYSIEHTFDDVNATGASPTVFTHSDVAAKTANTDGNYAFPISAMRLNITSGTGTVVVKVIQAGCRG